MLISIMGAQMATQDNQSTPPSEREQLVQVHYRLAIVTGVTSSNNQERPLDLVSVNYFDGNRHPQSDQIFWEIEPVLGHLKNAGQPIVPQCQLDQPNTYQEHLDSVRWTTLQSIQPLLGTSDDLKDNEQLPRDCKKSCTNSSDYLYSWLDTIHEDLPRYPAQRQEEETHVSPGFVHSDSRSNRLLLDGDLDTNKEAEHSTRTAEEEQTGIERLNCFSENNNKHNKDQSGERNND